MKRELLYFTCEAKDLVLEIRGEHTERDSNCENKVIPSYQSTQNKRENLSFHVTVQEPISGPSLGHRHHFRTFRHKLTHLQTTMSKRDSARSRRPKRQKVISVDDKETRATGSPSSARSGGRKGKLIGFLDLPLDCWSEVNMFL